MNAEKNYLEINKESWNQKTEIHVKSKFYDMKGFLAGKNSLKDIELGLLGDIRGKTVLHLQCHFGQDTISLSRMGAEVTGVDFSDKAIEKAEQLAEETGENAEFICCDIYDLPKYLDRKFDIVFTSYGTIGWLPDLDKWARVVSQFLKPGGKFIFVEFHPVVWMFDSNFEKVAYNYFNSGAIVETLEGSYAEKEADLSQQYVMWNHGLGEVFSCLLNHGLAIMAFDEYNYSPYDCFNHTLEFDAGKFRIKHLDSKIPMVYSILARKA